MKKCSTCKQIKELTEFYFIKTTGKESYTCKNCFSKFQKERRKRLKNYVNLFRIKCALCEEAERCCLDFHHLDRTTKKLNICKKFGIGKKGITIEILKCVVLCANCHILIENDKLVLSEEVIENWKKFAHSVINLNQ